MHSFATEAATSGSIHWDTWVATYQGIRSAAARLINSTPREIAIVKNTSEGISTVANGLRWRAGDKVVVFREEFPSNQYAWQRLEARGVHVEWLSIFDPLDRVEEACRGARLLAVSFVQYLSGYRADLDALGEICARHGVFFFVDAIQGLGAVPLDVRRSRIHALAADGHKWLLGPEGCGVLFVAREMQEEVEPVEFGWTNVAGYADYSSRDMTLRSDASRYECGSLNTIGCFGLRASLDFINQIGLANIAPVVESLGNQLWTGLRELGCETLGERSPATAAGIVSFRHPGIEAHLIVRRLKELKFIAAPRQGWVRLAPHFYISPDEIAAVLAAISRIASGK